MIRDPFYNGIIKVENAAIVLRVAQSFLKFGSFQVCKKGAQLGQTKPNWKSKDISGIGRWLIKNFYPEIDE